MLDQSVGSDFLRGASATDAPNDTIRKLGNVRRQPIGRACSDWDCQTVGVGSRARRGQARQQHALLLSLPALAVRTACIRCIGLCYLWIHCLTHISVDRVQGAAGGRHTGRGGSASLVLSVSQVRAVLALLSSPIRRTRILPKGEQ